MELDYVVLDFEGFQRELIAIIHVVSKNHVTCYIKIINLQIGSPFISIC